MVKSLSMLLLAAVVLMPAVGCSVAPGSRVSGLRAQRHWLASQGGVCPSEDCEQRLLTICEELVGAEQASAFRCRVLDSDEVAAYAWPKSDLFVTRGALQTLPEDELVAAVAHELGHLIDDGYMPAPATLRGDRLASTLNIELRADSIGVHLLRQAGRDTDAMARLLTRLCDDAHSHGAHTANLQERVERLQHGHH